MVNVLIAGDYAPSSAFLGEKRKVHNPFCDIEDVLKKSDYKIVNLEEPLSKSCSLSQIAKQGPSLIGDYSDLNNLANSQIDCVTLANNHIMDYGCKALEETLLYINNCGMDYVGVGDNIDSASRVLIKRIKDVSIAIINCCEHEFSIATETRAGANPLDPIKQFYQIQEVKKKADIVLMIIHGGVEHFQFPTPRMVKLYRFFIDAGADAIINHHQHCPCGFEEYNGKPIFYGLGNFFFPWKGKTNSIWNLGYMVKLMIEKTSLNYEIIPYRQCDKDWTVTLLKGDELKGFNRDLAGLNEIIQDDTLLRQKFKEYNRDNDFLYRKMLEPYSGRIMNALYRRGLVPSFMGEERLLALIDFLGCESHYERVMDYLNDKYYKSFKA